MSGTRDRDRAVAWANWIVQEDPPVRETSNLAREFLAVLAELEAARAELRLRDGGFCVTCDRNMADLHQAVARAEHAEEKAARYESTMRACRAVTKQDRTWKSILKTIADSIDLALAEGEGK